MAKAGLFLVAPVSDEIASLIPEAAGKEIYQSHGLRAHVAKRHPECLPYVSRIKEIVEAPNYVGRNPNEPSSFELVKSLDRDVLLGIKLDIKADHYYVATLHIITSAKVAHRFSSGRLKKT